MLDELQAGADLIRHRDQLRLRDRKDAEHELAHGIGRQRAVRAQLLPGLIRGHPLIDAVGLDQARERRARQIALLQRRLQRHEQRMPRAPGERTVEFLLEPVQRRKPIARGAVAELVDKAREAIDRKQVSALAPR